jgi:hypothetical protein
LNPRAESSYQRIIAALLNYLQGQVPGVDAHPSFTNESDLIEELARVFKGYEGLSVSNLSRKFPQAKRSLDIQ